MYLISCSANSIFCSSLSLLAKMPPKTLGWRVFTLPPKISGKPVKEEIVTDFIPAFFSSARVPPVEMISTPRLDKTLASSIRFVLSDTLNSALRIFISPDFPSIMINLL